MWYDVTQGSGLEDEPSTLGWPSSGPLGLRIYLS